MTQYTGYKHRQIRECRYTEDRATPPNPHVNKAFHFSSKPTAETDTCASRSEAHGPNARRSATKDCPLQPRVGRAKKKLSANEVAQWRSWLHRLTSR